MSFFNWLSGDKKKQETPKEPKVQQEKKEVVVLPPAKKVEQYNHLKERHADTILLFKVEDTYEVYQDDAIKVGKVLRFQVRYVNFEPSTEVVLNYIELTLQ